MEADISEESSVTPRDTRALVHLPFQKLATKSAGPCERYGHTAVLCGGNKMYVFGGCDVAGRFMNDLFVLNLETCFWECLQPNENSGDWPMARHFHGAVAVGSSFYVFFGKSNGYMNDVHRYDTVACKWTKIESGNDPPSRRYGHSVVEWNGDVFVFGGFDDFGLRCNDLWKFEVARSEWTPMLHLQSEAPDALHHSAVICQGSMLAWGGMDASSDLHEYRFGSRSWAAVKMRAGANAVVPRPKWGHRCFASDSSLFVLGGTDAIMGHSTVWSFSMLSCEWTLLGEARALAGRYFFSLVVAGPCVYIFGGKNSHNYAFDDVLVYTYRAAAEVHSVSSYRTDFARLLASASATEPGCIALRSDHPPQESVFGHACILFARVPALCERRALPADAATLRVMLRLIYTLELPPSLSQSVLTTLIALCHELAAWRLKERCEEELVVLLNEDNVVTLFKWVCTNKKMQMGRLASACIKMIVASFETLRGRLKELPDEYYVAVKTLARKKNEKQ